jgi:hypothetical protein
LARSGASLHDEREKNAMTREVRECPIKKGVVLLPPKRMCADALKQQCLILRNIADTGLNILIFSQSMAERTAGGIGVINEWLFRFAEWLYATPWSRSLHESFYMYNWIESTHVVTLMLSLGMLFIIDLRMLGLTMTSVPASRIAERLNIPMMIGFGIMIITGILLFYAVPTRTTTSIWFRIKLVLLIAAAVNAWLFHKQLRQSVGTWDTDPIPPKRIRMGAAISLALWAGVVTTGRLIAYDWFDCYRVQSGFINWMAGCVSPDYY